MKLDISKINEYVGNGLLFKNKHPIHDIYIYNYTPKVQFERLWDDITLQCRGLVLDVEGNILARPWKKFFNYSEVQDEANLRIKTNMEYLIHDKLDGSLGICFLYNNEVIFCTRGSFVSEQSVKGYEMLTNRFKSRTKDFIIEGYTYLFEILYKENRIVVDYGDDEKLILLSIIDNKTDIDEFTMAEWIWGKYFDGEVRTKHPIIRYLSLPNLFKVDLSKENPKDKILPGLEGFIITFEDGFKVKIKSDEYVELHKIMSNVTTRNIWAHLKAGTFENTYLDVVPDEFYDKVKLYTEELKSQFNVIYDYVLAEYDSIIKLNINSRKELAEIVLETKYPGLLFSKFDNRDFTNAIWDKIEPKSEKL